jgi:hypothetical protein
MHSLVGKGKLLAAERAHDCAHLRIKRPPHNEARGRFLKLHHFDFTKSLDWGQSFDIIKRIG